MLVAVASSTGAAEEQRVCLAPIRVDDTVETPNRLGYTSNAFSVRVDDGEWTEMPTERPTFYGPLKAADKHLLTIRNEGRVIESFWFGFEEGSDTLCLAYGAYYQTWQLEPPGRRSWCRCQETLSRDPE